MRTLLQVMTIAAVVTPLAMWLGTAILIGLALGALSIGIAVALGSAAVYSRGYRQTFFGGACAAAALGAFRYTAVELRLDVMVHVVVGIGLIGIYLICGILAVAVRRAVEARGWHLTPRATDGRGNDGKISSR